MKSKVLFLLMLFLPGPGRLFAQEAIFRHYSTRQGLSHNATTCILQDRTGFIWIGTEDGLNRFNGYDMDVFKHDPSNYTTISHSYIRCLFEDRGGKLWVGTDNGLNCFDRNKELFQRFENSKEPNSISSNLVTGITQDRDGFLWVATNNGLNRYDETRGTWKIISTAQPRDELKMLNNMTCITTSGDDFVWAGSGGGGIIRIHIKTFEMQRFVHDQQGENTLSENDVTSLLFDKNGNLWIGTLNEGLNRMDGKKFTFSVFRHDETKPSISGNSVFSLAQDQQGAIYAGTLGNGLNKLEPESGTWHAYVKNPSDPRSLRDNNIWGIFFDHAGSMWVATKSGISMYNPNASRFETKKLLLNGSNNVYCLFEDKQNYRWIGTLGSGLIMTDVSGNVKKIYTASGKPGETLTNDNVFSLAADQQGNLWAGTYDGLNIIDLKSGNARPFQNDANGSYPLSSRFIRALLCDRNGNMWIGTYGGGLYRFDAGTAVVKIIKPPGHEPSLPGEIITCLFEDATGNIYAGTYGGGFCCLDGNGNLVKSYQSEPDNPSSLSNNFINCFNTDNTGQLWVGTYGGGLNGLEKGGTRFFRYTEKNSLPNNVINGIIPDKEGYLWLATNKGICRFLPSSGAASTALYIKSYDTQDGAQDKYNEGAFLKFRNGLFCFGGSDGINEFNPSQITDNPYIPPVVITRFYLFEKPHNMDTMITSKRTVTLNYNQNFFSFEFAALNFMFPEKNKYAYMMEGIDKDWNYIGSRRYVAYTSLDPGHYTFFVKASNNDGVWNENGTALQIILKPPFWRTWWFSLITGLLIASAIFFYIRYRTRILTRQNILLEQKVAQRTGELKEKNDALLETMNNLKATQQQLIHSEKMASLGQLTAGIAHEIKNPLNFVNNFSSISAELIDEWNDLRNEDEKKELLNTLKQNLAKINQHGKRADSIVQSMLMHSRSGTVQKELTQVNQLAEDVLQLALTGFKSKVPDFDCEIQTHFNKALPAIMVIRQDISRVILNILNNALYAVYERQQQKRGQDYKPKVELTTFRTEKQVHISIRDNGNGIPDSLKEKIFQPFFTTKPAGEGTGLGLSLSYDIIVKGHDGDLSVESDSGQGSVFTIRLPVAES